MSLKEEVEVLFNVSDSSSYESIFNQADRMGKFTPKEVKKLFIVILNHLDTQEVK